TASDNPNGSGVKQITYEIDGGTAQVYSGPRAINSEGTHTITYRAEDNAGNIEASKTVTIKIDKTAPVITAPDVHATATSAGTTSVSFGTPTATDNLSGVVGSVLCTPASGSQFPLGATTVSCS